MFERNLNFLNGGRKMDFDVLTGFAINKEPNVVNQGNAFNAKDFRNQVLAVFGTGTVIVYGTNQDLPPDFTKPSSIDNFYVPITLADYSLIATYYAGATGAVVAGNGKLVELNTNVLTWIGIHRSATTVDVKVTESDNI